MIGSPTTVPSLASELGSLELGKFRVPLPLGPLPGRARPLRVGTSEPGDSRSSDPGTRNGSMWRPYIRVSEPRRRAGHSDRGPVRRRSGPAAGTPRHWPLSAGSDSDLIGPAARERPGHAAAAHDLTLTDPGWQGEGRTSRVSDGIGEEEEEEEEGTGSSMKLGQDGGKC
eukprot:762994-Hanusia_phi.AAC.15